MCENSTWDKWFFLLVVIKEKMLSLKYKLIKDFGVCIMFSHVALPLLSTNGSNDYYDKQLFKIITSLGDQ